MDVFAITSSKDNIYIIGPLTEENLWAFNIPKRIWFNPYTTVNISVNTSIEYAGKLNDTIYLIDSGDLSSMWKWNLGELELKMLLHELRVKLKSHANPNFAF